VWVNNDMATIFIVDDDESLRRSLARTLRAGGWTVEAFASAREFLRRPPYLGMGCVVLDVCLPELTGPELHIEMLARGITLPVVFLTAHGDVPTSVSAMKRGAVDFLSKPVDQATLLGTVAEAVERHVAERRHRQRRQAIDDRLARLSPREREVMNRVIAGSLNKQIAQSLGIALKTVKVHRAHVMQKMGVNSVAALVQLCDGARPSTPPAAAAPPVPLRHGSKVQWPHPSDSVYPQDWG
jgi:FixJ family two-component response regulator